MTVSQPDKRNFKKIHVFVILFLCLTNSVSSANGDKLFTSDKIIRMELRSDFSAIESERRDTPQYHSGELIFSVPGSRNVRIPVEVSARGKFRLNPDNCAFPPLFVNFKKGEVEHTLFENQDELKLVTPCQTEEYVVEEYLIYKMYNEITDQSFKVRLVKIRYFDTGSNKELFEKYSFFSGGKKSFVTTLRCRRDCKVSDTL